MLLSEKQQCYESSLRQEKSERISKIQTVRFQEVRPDNKVSTRFQNKDGTVPAVPATAPDSKAVSPHNSLKCAIYYLVDCQSVEFHFAYASIGVQCVFVYFRDPHTSEIQVIQVYKFSRANAFTSFQMPLVSHDIKDDDDHPAASRLTGQVG